MNPLQQKIDATYGSGGMADRLIEDLAALGSDVTRLSIRDLQVYDELHVMGPQATVALGNLAGLKPGMQTLDIGCGLGGPARRLAEHFGCHVTGADLSAGFVRAATDLSRRVGLAQQVSFCLADALGLPFEDHAFDAAIMIHINMNVADKEALLGEALRVIKPGAVLMLWEICAGDEQALVYPVPWADDQAFSHLISSPAMSDHLRAVGFSDLRVEDATDEAIAWIKQRLAAATSPGRHGLRPDLDLVLKNFRLKRANVSKNLMAGAIRILRARCTK